MSDASGSALPLRPGTLVLLVGGLTLVVLVFLVIRVVSDWPHILAGTPTDDDFARRYVEHPWPAYLHIAPGAVYLLGAPLQLSARFRTRHYAVHRVLGRVLLGCALTSGVFALVFGLQFAWGRAVEASATAVFGCWFLACLVLAFRAIRRGDVARHRRWMIRAFVVSIGISTMRLWVGLFIGIDMVASGGEADPLPQRLPFGIAFWLGFLMHAAFAEWWLRRTPTAAG